MEVQKEKDYKRYKLITESIRKSEEESGKKVSEETKKDLHDAWGKTLKILKGN